MTRTGRLWLGLPLLVLTLWAGAVILPVWLPPVTPQIIAAQQQAGPGPHRIFGYATLTNPLVRLTVLGSMVPAQDARLAGFRRDGRDMQPDQGAVLAGKVLVVDDAEFLRLDRYERLGQRYRRDMVQLVDGTSAWAYRLIRDD